MSSATEAGVKALLEGFPNQPTKIIGKPNYHSLHELKKAIKANASSVASPLGGGSHGYLGAVLTPVEYTAVSATAFVTPGNPGPMPAIIPGATQAARDDALRAYKESLANFQQFNNVTSALRKQIMNAIEEAYYKPLYNQHTGYNGITIAVLLTHLFSKHGKIKAADLALNDERMTAAWDGAEPFENIIARIDDCVEFALAGGDPYTNQQILTKAINIVFKTGLYNEAVREWNKKLAAEKTYGNFQAHFIEAQEQFEEEQANMKQAGFGANALVEQVHNLANIVVANDGTANNKLDLLLAQYAEIKKENDSLRALFLSTNNGNNNNNNQGNINNNNQNSGRGYNNNNHQTNNNNNNNQDNGRGDGNNKKFAPATDQGSYCWSHGYKCAKTHNSGNCQYPKPGHIREATRANNMGGSQKGKPVE
jgi:hypothetical protein